MPDMRPGDFPRWQRNYQYAFVHGPRRFRFFPRLFWFALGAGAFAMWSQHKEKKRAITAVTGGHNGEWKHWSGNHFGCHRRREQSPAQEWNAAPPLQIAQPGVASPASAAPRVLAPAPTPPTPIQSSTESITHSNEWQTEHIREVGKQATDVMAEISESAIDALMVNIQALKAKIAEAREGREKERLYLERRIGSDASNRKDNSERLA